VTPLTRYQLATDRAAALALTPVSRETESRLDRFVDLLLDWQRITNLIAPSTLPRLWTRHIADSLQLIPIVPAARAWIDLGSGAGFPGLVIACALADEAQVRVHLVESNRKKAAFLRETQRITSAPAIIHAQRAEQFAADFADRVDVVTARALAPLSTLLALCFPLLGKTGAVGLFPRGRGAELELAEAARSWHMDASLIPSRVDPASAIALIQSLERK
jgi:16S rRNA (guanine527-N7)-methyltransferase